MATLIFADGSQVEVKPANGEHFTLKEMQHYVGGYVEHLAMPGGRHLLLDEDGKAKGRKVNGRATLLGRVAGTRADDSIVGDVLFCEATELN